MVLLKVKEAAEFLGLNRTTVRKYIDEKIIHGIKIGKYRYVEKEELIRFQKEGNNRRDK